MQKRHHDAPCGQEWTIPHPEPLLHFRSSQPDVLVCMMMMVLLLVMMMMMTMIVKMMIKQMRKPPGGGMSAGKSLDKCRRL